MSTFPSFEAIVRMRMCPLLTGLRLPLSLRLQQSVHPLCLLLSSDKGNSAPLCHLHPPPVFICLLCAQTISQLYTPLFHSMLLLARSLSSLHVAGAAVPHPSTSLETLLSECSVCEVHQPSGVIETSTSHHSAHPAMHTPPPLSLSSAPLSPLTQRVCSTSLFSFSPISFIHRFSSPEIIFAAEFHRSLGHSTFLNHLPAVPQGDAPLPHPVPPVLPPSATPLSSCRSHHRVGVLHPLCTLLTHTRCCLCRATERCERG